MPTVAQPDPEAESGGDSDTESSSDTESDGSFVLVGAGGEGDVAAPETLADAAGDALLAEIPELAGILSDLEPGAAADAALEAQAKQRRAEFLHEAEGQAKLAPPAFAAEKTLLQRCPCMSNHLLVTEKAEAKVLYIGCESCNKWFHGDCVSLTNSEMQSINSYTCKACESKAKKSETIMASTGATESFEECRMRETQPTKPTKNVNIWRCFLSDKEVQQYVRDVQATEEHKHKHMNTIAKELWDERKLDPEQYAKFRALADQDKARYENEAAVYRAAIKARGHSDERINEHLQIKRPTKQVGRMRVRATESFQQRMRDIEDSEEERIIMQDGAVASIGMFCSVSGPVPTGGEHAGTGTLIGVKFGGVRHGDTSGGLVSDGYCRVLFDTGSHAGSANNLAFEHVTILPATHVPGAEAEKDEEQYKQVCDASGCDRVLGMRVGIYCVAKGDRSKTVCEHCGPEMMEDGWVDTDRGSSQFDSDEDEEVDDGQRIIMRWPQKKTSPENKYLAQQRREMRYYEDKRKADKATPSSTATMESMHPSLKMDTEDGWIRASKSRQKLTLVLRNEHNREVAFKLKTTEPQMYTVKPNMSRIAPNSSIEVEVQTFSYDKTQYMQYTKEGTAKFLVQTAWFNEANGTILEQLAAVPTKGKAPPGTWFAKLKVSAAGSWTHYTKRVSKQEQTQRQVDSPHAGLRFNGEADFAVGCVTLLLAFWLFWPVVKLCVALAAFALTFWFFLFWPLVKLAVLVVLPLLVLCHLFDRTRRNDAVLAMFDRCAYDPACWSCPWYDDDAAVRSRLAGLKAQRYA